MTGSEILTSLGNVLANAAVPILLAALASLAVAVLRRSRLLIRWQLYSPARRTARRTGQKALWARVRPLLDTFNERVPEDSLGRGRGAAFWELLRDEGRSGPLSIKTTINNTTSLLEPLATPNAHGVITSLVHAERIKELQDNVRAIVRSGQVFHSLEPLKAAPSDPDGSFPDGPLEFGRWCTTRLNTPILADALDARADIAGDVRIWNSCEYVGRGTAGTTFDDAHASTCPAWTGPHRAGDYDGRVLVVRSVSTFEDTATGQLVFVLTTAESCYASTEEGAMPWGCKRLPKSTETRPVARPDLRLRGREILTAEGTVQPMLTAFASVLTSDEKLVLCRRSDKTRNGPNVVSASGGGVFEPGDTSERPLDRDSHGWPDPTVSVQRELEEELGLSIPRSGLKPACVFLANSRNSQKEDEGQLVVCVLYLTRVELSLQAVTDKFRSCSDLAKGQFEVESLVPIETSDQEAFAASVSPIIAEFDQHALLSTAYTARLLWGTERGKTLMEALVKDSQLPDPVLPPLELVPDRYRQ